MPFAFCINFHRKIFFFKCTSAGITQYNTTRHVLQAVASTFGKHEISCCTQVHIICDRLWEKEQFPAKVDFAIITPKVGGVNFGHFRSSARGDSRILYLAAGTNASTIHP